MGKPTVEKNFPAVLCNTACKKLVTSRHKLFSDFSEHFRDNFIADSCVDHFYSLSKQILFNYIEIQMFATTKNLALTITGKSVRHFLTRQIVWAHQQYLSFVSCSFYRLLLFYFCTLTVAV